MTDVYDVLKTLDSLAKTTDKKKYLEKLDSAVAENFKTVAHLALSNHINLRCTDEVFSGVNEHTDEVPLMYAVEQIKSMSDGDNTAFGTNERKETLLGLYKMLSEEDQYVIRLIFKRNLQCGVGTTMINKIWPGSIAVKQYQRYSLLNEDNMERDDFYFIAQVKEDAKFANMVVDPNEGTVRFFSRDWVENTMNYIGPENQIIEAAGTCLEGAYPFVLHGEVGIVGDNGEFLPRSESNGKLNTKAEGIENLGFRVWDCIPYEDFLSGKFDITYRERLEHTKCMVEELQDMDLPFSISMVESWNVDSLEEASELFLKLRSEGKEGIMLKDPNNGWADGTSTRDFKVKAVAECDLRVTGVELGKNKYEGMVGSILLESECGMIQTKASGMTDDLRDPACWTVGEIVSVHYNDVSKARNKELYALTHPRFVEKRDDKHVADVLDDIQSQIMNATFFVSKEK